jgi:hypothetical protein
MSLTILTRWMLFLRRCRDEARPPGASVFFEARRNFRWFCGALSFQFGTGTRDGKLPARVHSLPSCFVNTTPHFTSIESFLTNPSFISGVLAWESSTALVD